MSKRRAHILRPTEQMMRVILITNVSSYQLGLWQLEHPRWKLIMPRMSEADQDAIDDRPSHWIIILLLALQCAFLAVCLVFL